MAPQKPFGEFGRIQGETDALIGSQMEQAPSSTLAATPPLEAPSTRQQESPRNVGFASTAQSTAQEMPSEEDYGAKLREMKKAARLAEAANRLCAQKAKQAADYAKRYRERRESVQRAVEADRAEIARLTKQIDELEQSKLNPLLANLAAKREKKAEVLIQLAEAKRQMADSMTTQRDRVLACTRTGDKMLSKEATATLTEARGFGRGPGTTFGATALAEALAAKRETLKRIRKSQAQARQLASTTRTTASMSPAMTAVIPAS